MTSEFYTRVLARDALVKQLFSFEGWDTVDTMFYQFYNTVTKVSIGSFPAGTKFQTIAVNFSAGFIEVYDEDGRQPLGVFELNYTIGSPLK